jgi:uncharacterized repeat protein (TIGR03809 family)
MTHQADMARGRDIVARWCGLAEQRLDYLTELFETGRWRRYHSETAFLDNIREAKAAVEAWRNLETCEASLDNSAVDFSWLGRGRMTIPRGDISRDRVQPFQPRPAPIPDLPPRRDVPMSATSEICADEAPSAPDLETPVLDDLVQLTLDTIEQRYPLLRNAL